MSVYKNVYGWDPFVLIENNKSMYEKDINTYNFIKNDLRLGTGEEIIYIHGFPSRKPEKSEISLILTNKNLITVLDKKARKKGEYVYTPLSEINENSIKLTDENISFELYVNDKLRSKSISFNSKRDFGPYVEIINDMISFLRNI
jgi:hypothetical protein